LATPRTRRVSAVVAALVVLALMVAACDSGTTAGPTVGGDCQYWCGNGSATVTVGGATTTISGGGCHDAGSAGYDIRFGDWQGLQGVSSWLGLTAYRVGGPTATPAATVNPLAAPSASDHPSPIGGGGVDGNDFVLAPGATVTFNANGTGSFSGTDMNGAGLITGTFSCG
jgi:predicted small secreted protein